jgi:hypothetical protein
MKTKIKYEIDHSTGNLRIFSKYFDVIKLDNKWYTYKSNQHIWDLSDYLSKMLKGRDITSVCLDDFWPNFVEFRFYKKSINRVTKTTKTKIVRFNPENLNFETDYFWI